MEEPGPAVFQAMMRLTPLLKYGRQGSPHFRNFELSADRTVLHWYSNKQKAEPTEVQLKDMKRLTIGQQSEVFRRNSRPEVENLSFSVFYTEPGSSTERSLDIVCKDIEEFEMWTAGLQWLIINKVKVIAMKSDSASMDRALAAEIGQEDVTSGKGKVLVDTHDLRNAMQNHTDAYTWGESNWGQLAQTEEIEKIEDLNAPKIVRFLVEKNVNVVDVACGDEHTVALSSNGQCYVWGHSGCGRLGVPLKRPSDHLVVPEIVAGALKGHFISEVACGAGHTLFLTNENKLFATGSNIYGQLGLRDLNDRYAPEQVSYLVDAKVLHIATGHDFSAAVVDLRSGIRTLFTWGSNSHGQLGIGDMRDRNVPTEVSVLRQGWNVVNVACGGFHIGVIAEDVQSHDDDEGDEDGGGDGQASSSTSASGSQTSRLSYKKQQSTANATDGRLLVWGWNGCGQLGLGDQLDRITPTPVIHMRGKQAKYLSFGMAHSAALADVRAAKNLVMENWLYVWGHCMAICRHDEKTVASTGPTPQARDAGATASVGDDDGAEMRQHTLLPQHIQFKGGEEDITFMGSGEMFVLIATEEGNLHVLGEGPGLRQATTTTNMTTAANIAPLPSPTTPGGESKSGSGESKQEKQTAAGGAAGQALLLAAAEVLTIKFDISDKDVKGVRSGHGSRHAALLVTRKWINDEGTTNCMSCNLPFTTLRRRHHCRCCGGIFCGNCTSKRAPVLKYGYQDKVRVCDSCYNQITNQR